MLVTRAMAEDAAGSLGLTLHDTLDDATVTMAYRAMAKTVHPDVGGDAEAFARVDRAKHVLLAWLAKPKPASVEHKKRPCDACGGDGYTHLPSGRPGSKGLRCQCLKCRGSGDMDLDTHSE